MDTIQDLIRTGQDPRALEASSGVSGVGSVHSQPSDRDTLQAELLQRTGADARGGSWNWPNEWAKLVKIRRSARTSPLSCGNRKRIAREGRDRRAIAFLQLAIENANAANA